MKRMDEMERNIHSRSTKYGFLFYMIVLGGWAVYNSINSIYDSIVTLVLIGGLIVQNASYIYMKHRMVKGDEEYREPSMLNTIITGFLLVFSVISVVLFIGLMVIANS